MKNYKFLIILFYYNRPKMVKNALISIKLSNFYYNNWELLFIDDGGEFNGEEILYDILGDHKEKIEYINTLMTISDKINTGGSLIGKYANNKLKEKTCDYSIMLCDDDALYPDYLFNLNNYFNNNVEDIHVYSNVIKYNPLNEFFSDAFDKKEYRKELPFDLNKWNIPINAFQKLDSSQVCWKIKDTVEKNILFDFPLTLNLDAWLYNKLYENFGPCKYTGFISQFKGIHDDTLSIRQWNDNMYITNAS